MKPTTLVRTLKSPRTTARNATLLQNENCIDVLCHYCSIKISTSTTTIGVLVSSIPAHAQEMNGCFSEPTKGTHGKLELVVRSQWNGAFSTRQSFVAVWFNASALALGSGPPHVKTSTKHLTQRSSKNQCGLTPKPECLDARARSYERARQSPFFILT